MIICQEEIEQDQKVKDKRQGAVWDTAPGTKHQDMSIKQEEWAWTEARVREEAVDRARAPGEVLARDAVAEAVVSEGDTTPERFQYTRNQALNKKRPTWRTISRPWKRKWKI